MKKKYPLLSNRELGSVSKHLHLTIEIQDEDAKILFIRIVNEPMAVSPMVLGPMISRIILNGKQVINTYPNPFELRAAAKPKTVEHYKTKVKRAQITVKVPLEKSQLTSDFRLDIFTAQKALPTKIMDLPQLLVKNKSSECTLTARFDINTIKKHPDSIKMQQADIAIIKKPSFYRRWFAGLLLGILIGIIFTLMVMWIIHRA